MKVIRQLFRQKLKMIFGIILLTMATAILCVCVGQSVAARTTIEELENSFNTIGLQEGYIIQSGNAHYVDYSLPDEVVAWLDETAQTNPDIVQGLVRHGMLSAYIPELTPINYTGGGALTVDRNQYYSIFTTAPVTVRHQKGSPHGMPYSCTMLTFTLEELGQPQAVTSTAPIGKTLTRNDFSSPEEYEQYLETREVLSLVTGYTIEMSGTVTGAVSLQKGYRDPTGMMLRIYMAVETLEEYEALELAVGGEYIAFSMEYFDEDWSLRCEIADKEGVEIKEFNSGRMKVLEGDELKLWQENSPHWDAYALYDQWLMLNEAEYKRVNAVSMTLGEFTGRYQVIRDEEGYIVGAQETYEVSLVLNDATTQTVTRQEFLNRYRVPMIAKLDTTAEDFLADEENALWREALEWSGVNYHSFMVLGAETLMSVPDFAQQKSRIVAGREFTEEEIESGARVCLINETLAAENGLSIGDTITLNLYQTDENMPYMFLSGVSNVTASFYFRTTPFTETAEYTIVGLWRGQNLWVDSGENPAGFSPNTVIVPKSSAQTEMKLLPGIPFNALIVKNGKVQEYRQLASQMGYENVFVFYDQGYTVISENFHNYDEMAEKTLEVGAALYAVLLLIFLLLFPASRRKTVRLMCSMGEPFGKRFWNVTAYAAALLLPAAVLGSAVGAVAWQSVVSALVSSTDSSITMAMNPQVLALVALVQCVPALLLNMLISLFVARPFGMRNKR